MLFHTIASIGKYAPIIRADNVEHALRLIRTFERVMLEQDDTECSIGLASIGMPDYTHDVTWGKDYASQGINDRMVKASSSTKQKPVTNWGYRTKEELITEKNNRINENEKEIEKLLALIG